jgi:beta-glucanase (GH16 family)
MWRGGIRATVVAAASVVVTVIGVLTVAGPAPAATNTTGIHDQFSGTKLDLTKWQYFSGQGCVSPKNVKVSGGYLHLITTKGNCGGRIGTRKTFQYGTVTASMYFDLQPGAHTGMTLFGTSKPWPWNGEIDIAEQIGRQPNTDSLRVWTQVASSSTPKRCGTSLNVPATVNHQWHTYAINWKPGSITFYLDGKVVWYWANWEAAAFGCTYPFDDPGYQGRVFFTSSVGGKYAGPPPPDHAGYPLNTLVDYVNIDPPTSAPTPSGTTGG